MINTFAVILLLLITSFLTFMTVGMIKIISPKIYDKLTFDSIFAISFFSLLTSPFVLSFLVWLIFV